MEIIERGCPYCGGTLKRNNPGELWKCSRCGREHQPKQTKKPLSDLKKEDLEKEQKLIEERKERLKKAALIGGATAVAAGGAYAVHKSQQPPTPQYPKKENPLLKYLLILIIIAVAGVVLWKFGPGIWVNVKSLIPPGIMESSFFKYLGCVWEAVKLLGTGRIEGMATCFERLSGEPTEEIVNYDVLSITTGQGEKNELPIPYGNKKYTVPVKIKNLNPDKTISISTEGYLIYKTETSFEGVDSPNMVKLVPERNFGRINPDSEVILMLTSSRENTANGGLNCSVEKYESITVEVEYPDYSSTKRINYVAGKSEGDAGKGEEKKPEPTRTQGPLDVFVEFSPKSYYPYDLPEEHYPYEEYPEYNNEVSLYITIENKVDDSEATLKRIKIEKVDSESLLKLDKCDCTGLGVEGNKDGNIEIDYALTSVMSYESKRNCNCKYTVNKDKVKNLDSFKTISFDIVLEYNGKRIIKRMDVPEVDKSWCELPMIEND